MATRARKPADPAVEDEALVLYTVGDHMLMHSHGFWEPGARVALQTVDPDGMTERLDSVGRSQPVSTYISSVDLAKKLADGSLLSASTKPRGPEVELAAETLRAMLEPSSESYTGQIGLTNFVARLLLGQQLDAASRADCLAALAEWQAEGKVNDGNAAELEALFNRDVE
jgi:hypothetical protein